MAGGNLAVTWGKPIEKVGGLGGRGELVLAGLELSTSFMGGSWVSTVVYLFIYMIGVYNVLKKIAFTQWGSSLCKEKPWQLQGESL